MPGQTDKKKTLKLKIESKINFKVIGISSHENDYRLVWSINEKLRLQFLRINNLVIHHQKLKEDLEFSRYLFDDSDRYVKYYLINNHNPDGYLFPELKNLDFLIQIIGEINDTELKAFEKKLKTVDVVSTAFILQPEKIKGIGDILVE
jgi:hypothetical protein